MIVVFNFWINVSVGDENVRPAIVIIIEETSTPAQVFDVRAESSVERPKAKVSIALIAVEVRHVVLKVCLQDIQPAVTVVISGGDSHTRLLAPILVIREAGL